MKGLFIIKAKKRAFTLVELLTIVLVIGILAAILIPNLLRSKNMANLRSCEVNLKNIATCFELYANECGTYPPYIDSDLSPSSQLYTVLLPYTASLKKFPMCPVKSSFYYYTTVDNQLLLTCGNGSEANHVVLDVPAGYPRFEGSKGIRTKP